jgi:hypothetical protein
VSKKQQQITQLAVCQQLVTLAVGLLLQQQQQQEE